MNHIPELNKWKTSQMAADSALHRIQTGSV